MTTDAKPSCNSVALSKAPVPILRISAKRGQLKKRLIACDEKFVMSCWDRASVLNESHEVLSPYPGEWLALIDECGISRSQAYASIKAFRRAQVIPPEAMKNFSGPSALMRLTSEKSLSIAKERALNGEMITVEKANEIVATVSLKSPVKSTAIKVSVGDMATLVIHAKRNSDIGPLRQVIEKAVQQFVNKEHSGNG